MTWSDLSTIRKELGLTERQFAALLGVAHSTYTGWGTRDKVPAYIEKSMRYLSIIVMKMPEVYDAILRDHGISIS